MFPVSLSLYNFPKYSQTLCKPQELLSDSNRIRKDLFIKTCSWRLAVTANSNMNFNSDGFITLTAKWKRKTLKVTTNLIFYSNLRDLDENKAFLLVLCHPCHFQSHKYLQSSNLPLPQLPLNMQFIKEDLNFPTLKLY